MSARAHVCACVCVPVCALTRGVRACMSARAPACCAQARAGAPPTEVARSAMRCRLGVRSRGEPTHAAGRQSPLAHTRGALLSSARAHARALLLHAPPFR
jgi:hypothetical protein